MKEIHAMEEALQVQGMDGPLCSGEEQSPSRKRRSVMPWHAYDANQARLSPTRHMHSFQSLSTAAVTHQPLNEVRRQEIRARRRGRSIGSSLPSLSDLVVIGS